MAVGEEQKSKKSKKGKKRGSRSSSAQRQRSKSGDEDGAGPQEDDLKPDFEAEAVERKPRFGDAGASRVNKAELFKPISQLEREKKALEYEVRDDKSTKTKKKGKKSKKGKKKSKKSKKNEDGEDDEDFDDDSEEFSDADDTDEEERIKKQKGERDQDEEPAGCCQFCFWNFREGHRCLSFFSFYNEFLSRPARWGILVMSWYLFMAFSGLFMGGANIIAGKENRLEQLVIGAITAMAMRFWVLIVTYLMMHPKENKVLIEPSGRITPSSMLASQLSAYLSVSSIKFLTFFSFWSSRGFQSVTKVHDHNGGQLGMGLPIFDHHGLYPD